MRGAADGRYQNVVPGDKFVVCCLLLIGGYLCVAAGPDDGAAKLTPGAGFSLNEVPRGLEPKRPVPEGNPLTEAKVELGRALFFDTILSANRDLSCATCHDPEHGFAQARALPIGNDGQVGRRNVPSHRVSRLTSNLASRPVSSLR